MQQLRGALHRWRTQQSLACQEQIHQRASHKRAVRILVQSAIAYLHEPELEFQHTKHVFHSGRQNVAEFWINFQNKFVHIRYFAVRNDEGKYLGTVELTQDLAPLRQLSGVHRHPLNLENPS